MDYVFYGADSEAESERVTGGADVDRIANDLDDIYTEYRSRYLPAFNEPARRSRRSKKTTGPSLFENIVTGGDYDADESGGETEIQGGASATIEVKTAEPPNTEPAKAKPAKTEPPVEAKPVSLFAELKPLEAEHSSLFAEIKPIEPPKVEPPKVEPPKEEPTIFSAITSVPSDRAAMLGQ